MQANLIHEHMCKILQRLNNEEQLKPKVFHKASYTMTRLGYLRNAKVANTINPMDAIYHIDRTTGSLSLKANKFLGNRVKREQL